MAFIVFAATDATNGTELWRTDGTAAGTIFLKDLNPGLAGSNAANFTRVGDKVFFSATTADGGSELWQTDGTADGTVKVKDIVTGVVGSFPTNFVDVNGTLYFSADDGSGQELWKSDGTADGTERVKDIVLGPNGSYPDEMINADGTLYFTATSEFGTEVWRSDGTDDGTVLVKDTYAGPGASGASFLTYLNGKVYYLANNGTNGFGLWSTAGADASVATDATLVRGEFALAFDLMTAGGKLFFTVYTSGGRQLWTSDGETGGTHAVSAPGGATNLTAFDGFVYFTATDSAGSELWKSNGNAAIPVADIALGAASSSPANLEVVGDALYFTATNGTDGVELWKTDGTTVELVRNINETAGDGSSPVKLTAAYHKLLFSADDGSTGLEPWSSNGTESGTVQLKEIAPGTNVGAGIAPDWLTVVGSKLFFRGSDSTHGEELWATDGSALGTYLVKDIQAGSASGSPFSIFDANGIAIFNATTTASGQEPWRSDGTEAGTTILVDTIFGPTNGIAGSFTSTTTHVFFFGLDPSVGYRLWTTDGTTSSVLYDSNVGLSSLTGIGNTLYFSAWDVDAGIELWKSDGTVAGTVRVADINPGGNVDPTGPEPDWRDSWPSGFTEMNGAVFFTAETETGGRELYRLDNDTVSLVKDIVTGPDGSNPSQLFDYNGLLLFDASDDASGDNSELWRSDGTEDGTFQLKDINSNPGESSSPFNFILFKNEAYFIANDAADPGFNRELWKTDGTEAGTVLLKDINGNADAGSSIGGMTVYGDYLYFAANDGVNGLELWRTDGTTDGTELFKNINLASGQGSAVNGSFDLTVFGDLLYFAADNGTDGPELWRTDGTADGTFAVTDVVAPAASNPLGYGLLPNSAPTASAGGGSPNYTENTAAILVDSGLSVDDVDNTTLMGATVSITGNFAAGQDVLSFADQNGITGSYNGTTGVLTLAGEATLAFYQTALRSVKYANTSEAPSTGTRTISFVANDGIDPSSPAFTTVTVTAVNDTPALVAPGPQTVDEDGSLVFSSANSNAIQASDIDIGSGAATATLDIADGALTLGSTTGLMVTGNGTSHIQFSGALADINTALSGLSYAPAANVNGSRQLSITFNDQGNTGLDPNLSGTGTSEEATASVAIEITAVNDAPVLLDAPAVVLADVDANAGAPVNGVAAGTLISSLVDFAGSGGFDNVSDVDAGAVTGIALTGTDTGSGKWFYSTNNGTTWTAVGAVSDSSALLLAADANTRLYFQPTAGFTGSVSNAITFRAWDQSSGTNGGSANVSTNGAATAFSTVSDTADITVTAVNGPPVSITTLGASVTQNFDLLPLVGSETWANGSTLPGWYYARTGTGATIVANDGANNAGNLYSYGTGTNSDRALGSVGSGSVGDIFWGIALINDTGATITSLEIAYTGEQWRNSAEVAQTVSFSYLIGSPAVSGTLAEFQGAGVTVPNLDFTSPITGGVAGALDGNLAANHVAMTFTINGLSIPNGAEIILRWSDPNHSGADHGLAIDDFSLTAQGDAPPVLDLDANNSSAAGTDFHTQYTPAGAAVPVVDTDVSLSDPDDTNMASATIAITNAKPSDLLAVNGALPSGITIDGASTATNLILTGSASLAAYQTALHQVEFSNSLANPDLTTRNISVSVNDGTSASNLATAVIDVNAKTSFAPPAQWTTATFGSDGTWHVGDFSGDGKDDLFRYVGGSSGADVFLSNGSAFVHDASWTPAGFGIDNTWHIGDFNGDGKDDIFRYLPQQSGADVFLSNGSAFVHDKSWTPAGFGIDNTWHIGDFNGDGKDDIFRYLPQQSGADMFLSNGSAFVHDKSWTPAGFGIDGTWHIGDFNGDGKDDIFRYLPQQSGAQMFLSDGSQFVFDGSWTPAGFGADGTWHIGDFNGDGKDDIFRYLGGTSGADVFLSNGSAFVHDSSWTNASPGVDNTWHIGDFDGDNTADLLRILANGVDIIV